MRDYDWTIVGAFCLAILGVFIGLITSKEKLYLLQDHVQVGECIAPTPPDFGPKYQTYQLKYFRVLSKGVSGIVVDIFTTLDGGETYKLQGQGTQYWTEINLTFKIQPCPKINEKGE